MIQTRFGFTHLQNILLSLDYEGHKAELSRVSSYIMFYFFFVLSFLEECTDRAGETCEKSHSTIDFSFVKVLK